MARYLVTGGAGFIGSNLACTLLKAGERVRIVDNLSTGTWDNLAEWRDNPALECVEADVCDAEAMAKAVAGVEVVFHHAADVSVGHSVEDPIGVTRENVGGTVAVLDAARRSGVRRMIIAGSCAAYGDTEHLPAREDQPPKPMSPYAASKLAGEAYAQAFSLLYGIETVSFRYFNIFGPRQRPGGAYAAAIPRFGYAALKGEPITIFGDGGQTRDFCYVDNVVQANLLAANCPHKLAGTVVNIGTGRRVTINAVARAVDMSLEGREVSISHGAPRAGDIRHSVASIEVAQQLLGFEPKVTWEEGLEPTLAYLATLTS